MARWKTKKNSLDIFSGIFDNTIEETKRKTQMSMTKQELATAISSNFFGERDTLQEAFDYAIAVAEASRDSAGVITALMVVANTIAKEIKSLADA
jgi:hypothetical protein